MQRRHTAHRTFRLDPVPTRPAPRNRWIARSWTPSVAARSLVVGTLPAVLVALTLGAPLAHARTRAAVAPQATEPAVETWVVVLGNGRVARGPAKVHDDGAVDVQTNDGEWHLFGPEFVVRAERERTLLAAWDALDESAPDLAPADRLAWLVERGLLSEAMAEADSSIEASPRDADLRSEAVRLGRRFVPDHVDADALFRFGRSSSRAFQEAALAALPLQVGRAELLERFRADARSEDAAHRRFAMLGLGRLFPAEDPRVQLLHAVYDPSPEVRTEAARAVGEIGATEIARPLVTALWSETPAVRTRAAAALGETRDAALVEPLLDRYFAVAPPKRTPKHPATKPLSAPRASSSRSGGPHHSYAFFGTQRAYVQDFDVEVARFSSVADPTVNVLTQGTVLQVGVVSITDVTIVEERRVILRALRKATGDAERGDDPDAWSRWWASEASAPYHAEGPRTR